MNRRGIALPMALLTLLILSAFAAVVLLNGRSRWVSGERQFQALQVRSLVESEVERIIATWDPLRADSLAVGAIVGIPSPPAGPGLDTQDSLLRLGQGLFLVRSVGQRTAADGSLLTREAVARVVRLIAPAIADSVAVLGAGPVTVRDLALVDGADHLPSGWGGVCPVPAPGGVGVLEAPAGVVLAACGGGPCIAGTPPVTVDSSLTPQRLAQLGAVSISELTAIADHHVDGQLTAVNPQVAAGTCQLSDSTNWGDSGVLTGACSRFFPIVEAAPRTRIIGGQGQGLLIGSGGLELSGDLVFSGVILAAGPLVIQGGARVIGAVLTEDSLTLADSASVIHSRCAIQRALAGAARPIRDVNRGWFRWR